MVEARWIVSRLSSIAYSIFAGKMQPEHFQQLVHTQSGSARQLHNNYSSQIENTYAGREAKHSLVKHMFQNQLKMKLVISRTPKGP